MSMAVREWYERVMYLFQEYVPTPIKNLVDIWVGENYLNMIFSGGFRVKIIVDANIIISEVISYFKNGKSSFLSLLDHTIIDAVSPSYILEEIEEHMGEIVKKTNRTEKEIRKVIKEKYISKIKLKKVYSTGKKGYEEIINALKERDPDDLPYLILYLSDNADAILSRDSHFISLYGIQTMKNVGHLKKVLYEIERGNLALLITVDVLPKLVVYIGRIIITALFLVMRALYKFAVKAIESIKKGMKEFMNWFSNLTPERKLWGVIVGLISAKIIYDNRERIQKNIIDPLKEFVYELTNKLIQFFKEIGNLLKDLTYAAAEIVKLMLENIKHCIEIYEEFGRRFQIIEVC